MQNQIKLLISPKTLEEANTIIEAKGVDYIDCKNPKEGSLGANFPWIINQMKDLIPPGDDTLLSAAIGDFPQLPGSASLAGLGAAVSGADIIKVGLKGPENKQEGIELMSKVVKAVKNYNEAVMVVAAGYADQQRMKSSPYFLDIPEIAAESGADIAMLDTFIKDDKRLFDFLTIDQLKKFKRKASALKLPIALAGRLKIKDMEKINSINPDIIGLRSAVCEGFDREKGTIKKELIQKLKKELNKE
ncbi:MAG: (5-formylfuran-3-yl)methyl phosphate synthase [Promethearchaeia archaeon]